jgi:hypothetical protein
MSFCAAHLSVAAWPGTAAMASAATAAANTAVNLRVNIMVIPSFLVT